MALGRISGPLLKSNLVRDGVDLSFETDLLYLSVTDADPANWRIGVKTDAPQYTLDVNGTTRSTNIRGTTVDIGNVHINGNTVSANSGDLTLSPSAGVGARVRIGTAVLPSVYEASTFYGTVVLSSTGAVQIPVGNSSERPTGANGQIRLNSEIGQYEGYSNGNWSSLGGVRSVDGLTYISAETSPGASDDTLHFYAATSSIANIQVATLNATKLAVLQTTGSTSTTTGALTVAGGAGIAENLYVGGNVSVTGNISIGGNITLGDQVIDSITVNADFTSDLIPKTTNTYSIGDTSFRWKKVWANTLDVSGDTILSALTAGTTSVSSITTTTTASVGTALTVGTTLGVTGATTLSTVSTSGQATLNSLSVTNNTLISGTLSAGATTVSSATVSNLTSTRLVLAGTSGALTDSNKLTFDGTILTVTANATISGNLTVDGNITLGGNLTIGDNVLDTVTVTADFTSDLIPKTTNSYDLGTSSLRWRKLYSNTLDVSGVSTLTGDITASGKLNVTGLTTLSTLTTTAAATLFSASITNDTTVGGNLSVTGTTSFTGNIIGNLIPNANGTQNIGGTGAYWNNLNASGTANLANFQLSSNTFSVTNTNGSITLQPNGTGNVIISSTKSLQIPVGNNSARPATPVNGMIRYNSELTQYEGYSSSNWSSLGGVRSVSGNAYIIAETSPGAGDDTLHFYAGVSSSVNVGNWTNTALTILSPGFKVPTGDTASRPTGVDGYIRFNSQINKFEGFANTVWSSLGGVSSTSGTTYIGAEAYPGAGDNTLYFYANGVQQATIDPTTTTIHNLFNVDNTTNSVSTSTGAIVTAGGIGIAKNLYVGINANIAGTLISSSDVTFNGANATLSFAPSGTGTVTINPNSLGSINNMSVGATTASTGRFTTLTATTSATFSPSGTVTINPTTASTMDNVSIGSNTRAPGAFTTLASNGLTVFTDVTASTSSASGAVVITGGTGIGGNLYVGGNINSTGTITAGSTLNANAAVNLNPANFNISIAPTGTGTATFNPATTGTINNMSIGASTRSTGAFTTLTSNNATTFTAGTASTTTGTGTVVVTGGVGISGAVNIGGAIGAGAATFTSVTDSGLTAGRVTFAGTGGLLTDDSALTYSSGTLTAGTSLVVSGSAGDITMTGGNITGVLGITASGTVQALSLKATNLTTGRVTYAGTSGVLQDSANLTFNGTTLTVNAFAVTNDATVGGTFGVTGATTLSSTLGVTGITSVSNVTDSSSTSTGALKVSGGVGIVKNLYVGGNSNIAGTETVTGTFTANGTVSLSPANYNVTISPTGTGTVTVNPNTLGAIDNVAVGANTRASGAFTTLASNGNATLSGNGSIVSLTPSGSGYVTINPGAVGAIDNMVIGGNTAKAGTFTALTATTSASFSPSGTVTINPTTLSNIDNVDIGTSTRGSGKFTTLDANSTITFSSTVDSSSSTSGAVQIAGGVGIAKKLYVGSNLSVTGTTTLTDTLTANGAVNLNPANVNVSIQPTGTGTATIAPAAVGAIDNMIIGANTPKGATFTTLTTQGNVTLNGSGSVVSLTPTGSGYVTINPDALGTINNMSVGATTSSTGKFTTLQATTSATFNTSGDVNIQPAGTVTIAPTTTGAIDNVNIGANTRGTAKVTTLDANGVVTFSDSTESTSTTTGALKIAGGVGIVKNLYVGGSASIAGNLTVLGTTTSIQSTVTTLTDPVISVGGLTDTGLVDAANRGVQTRYARDISSQVTSWTSDGSSAVVANLSVTAASLGFKNGDKINISGSGVTNLDGIGTVTTVGSNTVTFNVSGLVASATTTNIATVGLSKNGFFGYEPFTNKFVYIPDATISSNVVTGSYGDAEFSSLTLINALAVPQGGTGTTTFTTKGIIYGNSTSALQVTAASDMGSTNATTSYGILTTDSSNTPVWTDVIDCGTY